MECLQAFFAGSESASKRLANIEKYSSDLMCTLEFSVVIEKNVAYAWFGQRYAAPEFLCVR